MPLKRCHCVVGYGGTPTQLVAHTRVCAHPFLRVEWSPIILIHHNHNKGIHLLMATPLVPFFEQFMRSANEGRLMQLYRIVSGIYSKQQ